MECIVLNKQIKLKLQGKDGKYYNFDGFRKTEKDTVEITFTNGIKKISSIDHIFYIKDQEVAAKDLRKGDILDDILDDIYNFVVESIKPHKYNSIVYTPLEIESDNIYATSDGLINKNCHFLGSISTLINPDFLEKMIPVEPLEFKYGYKLKIWELPEKDAMYVLGVDSATGTGKDDAVIQVLKIVSKDRFEQVAVFADNMIDAETFAETCVEISKWYNDGMMIVENNEIGKTVADKIWFEHGCGNILNTDNNGKIGTRATKTSKLDACIELKRQVEKNILLIRDSDTIKQLSRYEEVAPNIFRGAKGVHDDLVSGLYWACYGTMQPQIDLENTKVNIDKLKQDITPEQTAFFGSEEEIWEALLL